MGKPNISPSPGTKAKVVPSVKAPAVKTYSSVVGGQGAKGPHELAAMIQAHQFGNVAMQRRHKQIVQMPPGMPLPDAGVKGKYIGT